MRLITSPVKEFPGTIEMPDFLTLPQVVEYSNVSNEANGKGNWEKQMLLLPVQVKLTGVWHISGLTDHPDVSVFPFTPAQPSASLLLWLHGEIVNMIMGENTIPNE